MLPTTTVTVHYSADESLKNETRLLLLSLTEHTRIKYINKKLRIDTTKYSLIKYSQILLLFYEFEYLRCHHIHTYKQMIDR